MMIHKEHHFLLETGSTTRGQVLLKLEGSAERVSYSNDAHNINIFSAKLNSKLPFLDRL